MLYKVTYEIEVDAPTPKKAALEVEDIMRNGDYRPFLQVTSALSRCKVYDFDLEKEEVRE